MKVRKILPMGIYDIPRMQYYLREQASKGLFLEDIRFFAEFKSDTPRDVVYRIDPLKYKSSTVWMNKNEMYEQFGWEYVCKVRDEYSIYKHEGKPKVEIFTDSESMSFAFQSLLKRRRYDLLIIMISLVIYFCISISSLDSGRFILALEGLHFNLVTYSMVFIFLLDLVKEVNSIMRLKVFKSRILYGGNAAYEVPFKNHFYSIDFWMDLIKDVILIVALVFLVWRSLFY